MLILEAAVREVLDEASASGGCELSVKPTRSGYALVVAQLGRWIGRRIVEAFSGEALHA